MLTTSGVHAKRECIHVVMTFWTRAERQKNLEEKKWREYNHYFFQQRSSAIIVDAIAPTTAIAVADVDKTEDENEKLTFLIVDDGTTSPKRNIPLVVIVIKLQRDIRSTCFIRQKQNKKYRSHIQLYLMELNSEQMFQ